LYPDFAELLNFSHPFQNNFRVADIRELSPSSSNRDGEHGPLTAYAP
jgi:hypothetical protein